MHHESWREDKMSDAELLMACAEPCGPTDNIQSKLQKAARHLKIGYWRAWNIWQGKTMFSREEVERANAYRLKTTKDLKVLRNEYRRALQILVGAAERHAAIDPDFHSEEIHHLRSLERVFSPGKDRS